MSIALSSLPVGAKVKDMTSLYPDGSPIIWTIIDHNHSGYPVNSTTLFANKYNGFKKSETSKNVSSYNFTDSDVYSYMVNEILGNHISSSLKKRILKTSVTLFNWYGSATYDKNIIKKDLDIFLLSYGEMSSSGNLNSGDSRFSYFNDRSKRISSDAGYGNSGYWTKDVQNSNNLKVLNFYKATSISSDTISYSFYSDEQHAIRPVINVKNDIEVQGSPDVDGAYVMSLVENKYIFKDGEEIKKYSSHDSSSVPEMEGYNTPEGLVSSSKELAAGYEAWKAFNSSSGFWHSGTAGAQWISYRFSEAKKITKYSWKTYTATGAPKDWKFEGWDGQKWVVLDIRIGEVGWSNQQEKTYEFSNSNSYIEYRFNLTANNGNGNYDPVYIKLFESPSWEVIGNSIASKELFDLHGMTDLSFINDEAMQQLSSDQVELLCWTEEIAKVTPVIYGETDAVPRMTSNNTPFGVVSASSQYSSNYLPWKIFDDTLGVANCWASAGGPTQWVQYKFDAPKRIGKMTMTASGDSGDFSKMPSSFSLKASNTGLFSGEENILHTEVESTHGFWSQGEKKTYVFGNDQEYLYYRLVMTDKQGAMGQPVEYVIHEMELFEVHGSNVSVPLKRDLRAIAIPKNMILISSKNTNVENIEKMSLNALNAKIIISQDNGNTWVGKTEVEVNDLASVKANGFTTDELNALTKEQIATLFPNGTARFAFYLEQENWDDVVEIQSLSMGEKQYTISPTATDLALIYEVLQEEKPTLYASRDDGVSWKEIRQDEMASLSEQPEGKSLSVKAILKNGQEIHALSYAWA